MVFLKKRLALSIEDRRLSIDPHHARLTVQQQCELLGLPRSTYYYYQPLSVNEVADVMGVSPATVKRDWQVIRLWLYRKLTGGGREQ